MKEIYQAFRSAGVKEMEAIKVTDSFNDIINRLEKESTDNKLRSADSKLRFEQDSNKRDKEILINRILMGFMVVLTVGVFVNTV